MAGASATTTTLSVDTFQWLALINQQNNYNNNFPKSNGAASYLSRQIFGKRKFKVRKEIMMIFMKRKNLIKKTAIRAIQSYFGIDDLSPYENILITDLDIFGRLKWCLKYNAYETLTDILKSSQHNFF